MENYVGRKVGRFQITEKLGMGGMAEVYRAFDPDSGKDVAMKILPLYFAQDPEFAGRFRQEAQTLIDLKHPAIVRGVAQGVEDGVPYLAMDYLSGGSLQERLKATLDGGGQCTEQEALTVLKPVAAALDYAHQKGVVHRDVKPSNILFDESGAPFLTDFGIIKVLEGDTLETRTGVSVGTPAYMSPEAINANPVDGRSDVYALGIILYQLLSGRLPFEGDTPARMMMGHLNDPIPNIRLVRPDLPHALTNVIEKVLAKQPADRYQTAGEFANDFQIVVSTTLDPGMMGMDDAHQRGKFFDYLQDLGKGAYARYEAKLMIVGEGGVGKSSLLRALQGKGFVQGLKTTHGVDVQSYRLPHPQKPEAIITLNVWDFGGQQIYHTTHQFFMTPRSLYLLVWNARGDTEQARLDHWLRNIQILAPDAPVVLVGTHVEGRPLDFNYGRYKESYPQIVSYVGVSSRDGIGIETLKELIAQEAAKLDLMEQQWPENWVNAEIALSENPAYYLTAEDYLEICVAKGVSPEVAQSTLGSYLHDLGKLLYYKDDVALADFVVLRPNWLTQAISRVLDDDSIKHNNGILAHSDFPRIWDRDDDGRPYEKHLHARFLHLMERFLISFRLESGHVGQPASQSLVPIRLNHAPPPMPQWEEILPGQPEIQMVFRMRDFVPPGIMSWFIVLTHDYTQNLNWREGVRLQYKRHQAEVTLNPSRRELWLRVKGPAPHNLFNILQHTINDRIMERYFIGLAYTREVPCNCHRLTGAAQPCAYFHDYKRLSARRERGRMVAECGETFEEVSVTELLEGIHQNTHNPVAVKLEETKRALVNLSAGQQNIWSASHSQLPIPERANLGHEHLIQISAILSQRFNLGELRNFCFQMGVDYEELPEGGGKSDKARELVLYCQRRDMIMNIIRVGEKLRPEIAWRAILDEAARPAPEELVVELKDQNQLLLLQNSQYFEQLTRNFTRLWNHQLKRIGVEFPNAFIILPENEPPFTREIVLQSNYSIHLLCQYPAAPHLACPNDGYELKELEIDLQHIKGANDREQGKLSTLEAWLLRATPWLRHLRDYLSYIPQKGFADDMEPDFIREVVLSVQLIDALLVNLDQAQDERLAANEPYVAETQALQVVYIFFRQAEKQDKWCGLQRVITNDGNIFWLCDQHRQLYETL